MDTWGQDGSPSPSLERGVPQMAYSVFVTVPSWGHLCWPYPFRRVVYLHKWHLNLQFNSFSTYFIRNLKKIAWILFYFLDISSVVFRMPLGSSERSQSQNKWRTICEREGGAKNVFTRWVLSSKFDFRIKSDSLCVECQHLAVRGILCAVLWYNDIGNDDMKIIVIMILIMIFIIVIIIIITIIVLTITIIVITINKSTWYQNK